MNRSLPLRSSIRSRWAGLVALVLLGAGLFYWYELRPIRLYRSCAAQASADARTLLQSKAEIAAGTDKGTAYAALMEKNMYLRTDYQSFLQKCLLHYGLPLTTELPAGEEDGAATGE